MKIVTIAMSTAAVALTIAATTARQTPDLPASAFLAALPDGEVKRRFILDCTGCHSYRDNVPYPQGKARTAAEWEVAIQRMVSQFGPQTGFPVIGPGRDPAAMAQWLASNMPAREALRWEWPANLERKADIREYLIPAPQDLPHDVAVAPQGIAITGMFTGQMYILDPETGTFTTEATPAPNPRAVEIAPNGDWWVVLGGPRRVARRTSDGQWSSHDAGFYAHSVALAPDGGVWLNGHFTHQPELMRRVDPVTGAHRDFELPPHPTFQTTPVPYEVRSGPDGTIWMSELQGNRIIRLDPSSGASKAYDMPTTWSGPRRLDVDPRGILWIPEYSANKLARFDPATETFTEYELPIRDAAPYIARYDARRNVVWIATGSADALLSFDPARRTFAVYRLPTKDQLVRHMTVDARTGDLWLAPGSSPGSVPARVIRVRPQ